MTILTLECSNKPVKKEIKIPMLFDNRGQAEKKSINLVPKGLSNGKKCVPCSMQEYKH